MSVTETVASVELMIAPRSLAEMRRDPQTWAQAAAAWLDSKQSPNTRATYERAVWRFFAQAGKGPWQIAGSDVVRWQSDLRKDGLKESSINLYLAALSSLYCYCMDRYTIIDPATGREESLAATNPANRAERAKVTPYGRATFLTADQIQYLLLAVDRGPVTGKRDYALLVGYVLTGARNSELRQLRWGDLAVEGDQVIWSWSGKGGKTEQRQFPWPAYHLITDYLEAAGRLDSIGDTDHVFIAQSDVAERLPNVDEPGADGDAPLSSSWVNRLVKRYARLGGIKQRVTCHSLRHSAAMLRRDHSTDIMDLQRFLHHSNLSTTQIYIDHVTVRSDTIALRVAAQLGIE